MTERRGAFIYRDSMSRHVLREDHVFKPVRLRYTYELLEAYQAFEAGKRQTRRPASRHR